MHSAFVRPPRHRPPEWDEVLHLLESRRKRLAEGWLDIRAVSTGDSTKLPGIPANTTPQDAAAWTLVSRVVEPGRNHQQELKTPSSAAAEDNNLQ